MKEILRSKDAQAYLAASNDEWDYSESGNILERADQAADPLDRDLQRLTSMKSFTNKPSSIVKTIVERQLPSTVSALLAKDSAGNYLVATSGNFQWLRDLVALIAGQGDLSYGLIRRILNLST